MAEDFGAWDEPTGITPDICGDHNWLYTGISDEYLCVRCGLREDATMHRWVERDE